MASAEFDSKLIIEKCDKKLERYETSLRIFQRQLFDEKVKWYKKHYGSGLLRIKSISDEEAVELAKGPDTNDINFTIYMIPYQGSVEYTERKINEIQVLKKFVEATTSVILSDDEWNMIS